MAGWAGGVGWVAVGSVERRDVRHTERRKPQKYEEEKEDVRRRGGWDGEGALQLCCCGRGREMG